MTRPADLGDLVVSAADAPVLAALVREGARSFGTRRRLTPTEARLLTIIDMAAYCARRAATATGPGSGATAAGSTPASSSATELTVKEVAGMLGRSERRVRQLVAAATLPARRPGHALLVDAAAVAAYALAHGRSTEEVPV